MIQTANGFFTHIVDDNYLDEIKEDLNEYDDLIGYSHDDLEGNITLILKVPNINTDLHYIQ